MFDFYYKELISLVNQGMIKLPYVPSSCNSNNHIFYIVLEDEKTRNNLMDFMKVKGILSVFHYLPLHLSPMGRSMGYSDGQFLVTETMSSRLLRLPFYYELKTCEQEVVVDTIKEFFKS